MKKQFIRLKGYLSQERLLVILYFFCTALLLASPAFYNRYPLVSSDSGTYMASSFSLIPPLDRPIGYGLFIRAVSWQASMWPVVFFQGLIASILIFKTIKLVLESKRLFLIHFAIVLFLTLFSSLAWYSSQIMPDVFASFLIITLFLFLNPKNRWWETVSYFFLLFLLVISHFSHLLIAISLVILALLYLSLNGIRNNKQVFQRICLIGLSCLLAIQFLMINNSLNGNGYRLNVSSSVFLTARFAESGILYKYLKKTCPTKSCAFCLYADSLPDMATKFIWDSDGPLAKSGLGWKEADRECSPIVTAVFTDSEYLKIFIGESFKATLKQLFQLDLGSGLSAYRENSAPFYPIKYHLGSEINEFLTSEQSYNKLNFSILNLLNYLVLAASLLLIFACFYLKLVTKILLQLIVIVSSGIALNAAVTASLANVYDRLQARVSWLIIFVALLCLFKIISHFKMRFISSLKTS
jgi:hypothetical protein